MKTKYLTSLASMFVVSLTLNFSAFAISGQSYPLTPDRRVTPGVVCSLPIAKRYPQQISYCGRLVSPETKDQIFATYRNQLGYTFEAFDRSQYKIDHLVPLCAGGSNDIKNLWPQHISIAMMTDSLEELVCEKMSQGRLSQRKAIELVFRAKRDPTHASYFYDIANRL